MNNSTQRELNQFALSRKFNSGFGLELTVKDLSIALRLGREAAAPAPFSAQCREIRFAAAASLCCERDHPAAVRFSEMLAAAERNVPLIELERYSNTL